MGYTFLVVLLLMLLASSLRIVQEYERGVIFRLGRCVGARGPGIIFLIPGIERMQKVDLRVITMDVPTQEAVSYTHLSRQDQGDEISCRQFQKDHGQQFCFCFPWR